MKFGFYVCLLVLLGCHETLCRGPVLLTGNCQLEDLPEHIRNECGSVHCTKDHRGGISWSRQMCPWANCGTTMNTRKGRTDLTKTYPDCCPHYTCY